MPPMVEAQASASFDALSKPYDDRLVMCRTRVKMGDDRDATRLELIDITNLRREGAEAADRLKSIAQERTEVLQEVLLHCCLPPSSLTLCPGEPSQRRCTGQGGGDLAAAWSSASPAQGVRSLL